MSDKAYEQRQETKKRHARYRKAAARFYPGLVIRSDVAVNEVDGGAYVELTAFISRDEAERETNE